MLPSRAAGSSNQPNLFEEIMKICFWNIFKSINPFKCQDYVLTLMKTRHSWSGPKITDLRN